MKSNPDYSQTVIYKLVNYSHPELLYIGHTTNFYRRQIKHKSMVKNNSQRVLYKTIRDNGGWDDWDMVEILKYPCKCSVEARQEEQRISTLLNSNLNSHRIILTDDERTNYSKYYNKTEQRKKYLELNKENINKKVSEKVICDCGCAVRKDNMSKHKQTKKHINLITNE